jgi:hypothetical protein
MVYTAESEFQMLMFMIASEPHSLPTGKLVFFFSPEALLFWLLKPLEVWNGIMIYPLSAYNIVC